MRVRTSKNTTQPAVKRRRSTGSPRHRHILVTALSLLVVQFAVWLGHSPTAQAAESTAQHSERATVTLISDVDQVAPGTSFRLGLRQRLAPHWHTYWKNPGDAGVAPEIQLTLPDGATAEPIAWPGPDRIDVGPARNFGYEQEVVLPITVHVHPTTALGTTFAIEAQANWLVCEEVCIPESGTFQLALPVGQSPTQTADDAVTAAFAEADARMPEPNPWPAFIQAKDSTVVLHLSAHDLPPPQDAFFYPHDWGVLVHAAPQPFTTSPDGVRIELKPGPTFDGEQAIAGLLAITDAAGQQRWFETELKVADNQSAANAPTDATTTLKPEPSAPHAAPTQRTPLWYAALFAFLGGLLLNLMPCVFPVLAMKATSLAKLSGGALKEVRRSSFFYTLGVLVAFSTLAALLLALRAGGQAIGWGFQFQSPVFVGAMCWLMLAIGLNLSGVYEIGLTVTGTGQQLAAKSGHAGSFFTGLLAVVVATPCTAPFMGVAIGTALSAPALICILVFWAMGLGLAAPYTLLALRPQLAHSLPRPGAWMVFLRKAMAYPMYGSAVWLAWVLMRQTDQVGLLLVLAGAPCIALAAQLYGLAQQRPSSARLPRTLAAAILLALALLLPQVGTGPAVAAPALGTDPTTQTGAEPFSAARLTELQEQGQPVFVNLTAAWCITCLVNERTTLATEQVHSAFAEHGIAYLKGDWTNRNAEIARYLQGFNRDGLPFYAFYPADGSPPKVLPPVLTPELVIHAVQ